MLTIRTIKILILAATALVLLLLHQYTPRFAPLSFSSARAGSLDLFFRDTAAYEAIKKERIPADLAGLSLEFNGYALVYDKPTRTYYYSLVEGDKGAFSPDVSLSVGSGEFGLAFLRLPISEESIRKNARHPFIVYNDTNYAEFFFSATHLPVLNLESNHPDYTPDDFISEKKAAVRMTLFDNRESAGHTQRVMVSEADINVRGASSTHFPQRSYKLALSYVSLGRNKRKNPLSLLDMRVDKDWILYSPFNDPEKIRNILSSCLWWDWGAGNNDFGIQNGSRGKFVELFINGRYQGVYGLQQPLDGPQLKIRQTGDWTTTDFYYRKVHNKPALEQDLFKRGHRSGSGGFEVRSPKSLKAAPEKWNPLAAYLRLLGSPDEGFKAHIAGATDVDNAIDLWLFVNLVMGVDNITKNMGYLAKWNGERHTMLFSPWDLDITWGMNYTGEPPWQTEVTLSPDLPLTFAIELPGARMLLLDAADSRAKARKRYFDLRGTVLSDANMAAMLAAYERDIFGSGAFLRNREKWPTAAYAADMAAFKQFIVQRVAFMDKAIADL